MSEAPEAHRSGVGEREQLSEPGATQWRGAGTVPSGSIVAIVAAKDRSDLIAASVRALAGVTEIDRIVVVDDGSTDDTAAIALATGQCEVIRLRSNRGKGGAVTAGFAAAPDAGVYVLIDADLAVLGASESAYRAYAEKIRQEYAWVSEPDYRTGRRELLERFLARPRIFRFLAHLEEPARRNLAAEIAQLAGG